MGPGTRVFISIGLSIAILATWLALYEITSNEAFGDLGIIILGGPSLLVGFPLVYGLRAGLFQMVGRPIETVRPNEVRAWTYAVFALASMVVMRASVEGLVIAASWVVYVEVMDMTRIK